MSLTQINGQKFAKMVQSGANNLTNQVKFVDSLNVFPVPDGDTGTNMNLSMTSGAREVSKNTTDHIGKVATSLSKGLLMGARGNSGVILSQLFRGFGKAIESKETITTVDFATALAGGVTTAYKAVIKPIEGTILTVAKDTANYAVKVAEQQSDFILFLEEVLKEAHASLERTPDLLPVLKEVGVVDSGGQGLVIVYEGMLAELKNQPIQLVSGGTGQVAATQTQQVEHVNVQAHLKTEDIEFGYCTEFMVQLEDEKLSNNPFNEGQFRKDMGVYGDSLLVVSDDEIVKVHIHAEHPGEVLNYAQRYGSLINLKIENMRQQHTHILEETAEVAPVPVAKPKQQQEIGIVTISMGRGIKNLFESLGASVVIEGGQTMNPSTEDIVKAIEEANAKKVIILPNNGNIIMAAQQAASVVGDTAVVVPSKSVPQGLSALLSFNPMASLEENAEEMKEALGNVKTGLVTFAVRDTQIDGVDIAKDDFMGIAEGKIVASIPNREEATKQLLKSMMDEDSEIVTIIKGEDVTDEECNQLVEYVEETFEDVEVEVHDGEQPLYSYIFSVE